MFAVEPIGCDVGNEKLTAVGVRAGVRHGQAADLMFVWIVFYFVFEPVTRAAAAGPGWVAALDHEVGDHAMKDGAVVKFFAREKNEIVHRFRCVLGKEIAHDFPARGLKRGGVLLVRIDRHRGRRGIFFGHREGKYELRIKKYEVLDECFFVFNFYLVSRSLPLGSTAKHSSHVVIPIHRPCRSIRSLAAASPLQTSNSYIVSGL